MWGVGWLYFAVFTLGLGSIGVGIVWGMTAIGESGALGLSGRSCYSKKTPPTRHARKKPTLAGRLLKGKPRLDVLQQVVPLRLRQVEPTSGSVHHDLGHTVGSLGRTCGNRAALDDAAGLDV